MVLPVMPPTWPPTSRVEWPLVLSVTPGGRVPTWESVIFTPPLRTAFSLSAYTSVQDSPVDLIVDVVGTPGTLPDVETPAGGTAHEWRQMAWRTAGQLVPMNLHERVRGELVPKPVLPASAPVLTISQQTVTSAVLAWTDPATNALDVTEFLIEVTGGTNPISLRREVGMGRSFLLSDLKGGGSYTAAVTPYSGTVKGETGLLAFVQPQGTVVFFDDDFNRPDSGDTENGWTSLTANARFPVKSNQMGMARGASDPNVAYQFNVEPNAFVGADQFVQADVTAVTGTDYGRPTVALRVEKVAGTNNFNGYYLRVTPGATPEIAIRKRNANASDTTLAAVNPASVPSAPYTLRLEAEGGALRGYVNGTLVVNGTDATPHTAGRYAGVGMRYEGDGAYGQRMDNFKSGDLAAVSVGPATNVTVTEITKDSFLLSYAAPLESGGAPIASYRVGRDGTDAANSGPYEETRTSLSIRFSNLLPDTPYSPYVNAINADGKEGPQSVVAVRTLAALTGRDALVIETYWPDETNTGLLTAESELTPYTGPLVVTEAGLLIENKIISGEFTPAAANIKTKNCLFLGATNVTTHTRLINCNDSRNSNFIAEDCELRPQQPSQWTEGMFGKNFTARRLKVHDLVDCFGITGPGVVIEGCYGYDFAYFTPCDYQSDNQTHNDVVQFHPGASKPLIRGNTFLAKYGIRGSHAPDAIWSHSMIGKPGPTPAGQTFPDAAVLMFGSNLPSGSIIALECRKNRLYGGLIPVNGTGPAALDIGRIVDNVFDADSAGGPETDSGTHTISVSSDTVLEATGNVFPNGVAVTIRRNL